MLVTAIAPRASRTCLFLVSMVAVLLPACAAPESTEPEETGAAELRAFFEGTAPIPGLEGRARHRAELARLATRAAGARRAGLDPDVEDGWWPVAERTPAGLVPADTAVWQRDGDIDVTGAFVPLRGACPPRAPLDIAALPPEIRATAPQERGSAAEERGSPDQGRGSADESGSPGQERGSADEERGSADAERGSPDQERGSPDQERGSPDQERGRADLGRASPGLGERAARLACALDRLAGEEVRVAWAPGQSQAAILDADGGTALVNPRLLALVEPDALPRHAPGAATPPGAGAAPAAGPGPGANPASGDPPAEPLDWNGDDNQNHPRPPSNDSGGSSRTFCDRVCDDVWNDAFQCDCNGSPGDTGTGNDACDCGGSPGSSSSGCGAGACKCGTAQRGAQDRTGLFTAALLAGTLLLRRRRPRRASCTADGASRAVDHARRALRRFPWLLLLVGFLPALLAWPPRALAGPPAKLVDVHVTVTPPEAAVFVDGNAVTPERGVVRLPAGSHTFSAKLEGYSDATQTVEVQGGGTGTLVTLRLVANQGYLVITGRDPAAVISIDGARVGQGSYSGLVAPGNHVITATDAAGRPRSYVVTAIAGQSVSMSVDGPPTYFPPPPPAAAPPPPPAEKKPEKPRPPPPRGPYVAVNAAMFWQTGRPYGFEHGDTPAPGFAVGGRGGYRFTEIVGLEALVEYARVANGGVVAQTYDVDQDGDGLVSGGEAATDRSPADYTLEGLRIGPVLRLTSPGRDNRFLGGIGLGALHEQVSLNHADLAWDAASARYASKGTFHHHYEGWSPYLLFEGGYERSIQAFLAAVLLQITVESVSGIDGEPYNSSVQARLGLCLRAGWSAW